MIRGKMQPTTAWRTIHCHVKVHVLITVLLITDYPGVVCLALEN